MSTKLKFIAVALAVTALASTPALASTFHKGWVLGANGTMHRGWVSISKEANSAHAYVPAQHASFTNDPTMMMIKDHIPVRDHGLPGFGARP